MKQKDVYIVNLNPIEGHEQSGIRPAVIISGSSMNKYSPLCICCPLSSQIKNYSQYVKINKTKTNKLKNNSEALVPQIRALSKTRFIKKIGEITDEELSKIKIGLSKLLLY